MTLHNLIPSFTLPSTNSNLSNIKFPFTLEPNAVHFVQDIEATIHCAEWLSMVGGSSTGEQRVR